MMKTGKRPGFFAKVLASGMLLTIWGKMRAGKSNLASFLVEKGVDLGYYVYTNIHFFRYEQIEEAIKKRKLLKGIQYRRKPSEITTVTKISGLLYGLFKTDKNITILDETALFASSSMGTSKKVRWLKALTFTIGKLDSSLILIAQDKGSVIPMLRKTLVSYEIRVRKINSWKRMATIYFIPESDGEEEVEAKPIKVWKNLKPTRLPFDSKGLVKFDFDIDIEEFFNRIAEYNSLDAIEHAPLILDKMLEENKTRLEKKKSKKELITEIVQETPKITTREIIHILSKKGINVNRQYVSQVKNQLGISML